MATGNEGGAGHSAGPHSADRIRSSARWAVLLLAAALPGGRIALAQGRPEDSSDRFALHGQMTYVEQEVDGFHAPYRGRNSLTPARGRETVDLTVFAGARLWAGAEVWINPEVDQGFGLDNTVGMAGFPSAEAYKVGANQPYLRWPRLFIRQLWNLGGPAQALESGPNQFGQAVTADHLVLTVGKFSVVDVFDLNRYAHDPRGDFLNWTVVDAGSFDYAADAWAYTVGAALEWYTGPWALRGGVFALSDAPNSTRLEPAGHEYQMDYELEHRLAVAGEPGKLTLTLFESKGRMARLQDALDYAAAQHATIDLAAVRRLRRRDGISAALEQQLSPTLGVFLRVGAAAGNVEAYEFTEVDRTISGGVSAQGLRWRRPDDTVALAFVGNQISSLRRRYLAAGGLGVLVGDGRLPHAGPEHIAEAYYRAQIGPYLQLTLDYQWAKNPAYNSDRGPVSIFAVRVHAQL